MTEAEFADFLVEEVRRFVEARIEIRVPELLQELVHTPAPAAAIKAVAPLWRGVHESGRQYQVNDLVTRAGGLWIATATTAETPGNGATAWRLAVKAPR